MGMRESKCQHCGEMNYTSSEEFIASVPDLVKAGILNSKTGPSAMLKYIVGVPEVADSGTGHGSGNGSDDETEVQRKEKTTIKKLQRVSIIMDKSLERCAVKKIVDDEIDVDTPWSSIFKILKGLLSGIASIPSKVVTAAWFIWDVLVKFILSRIDEKLLAILTFMWDSMKTIWNSLTIGSQNGGVMRAIPHQHLA